MTLNPTHLVCFIPALGFSDVVEEEVSRPLPYCRLELSGSMAIPVDTTAPKQPRVADTPAIVLNKLTHLDPTKLLVQKDITQRICQQIRM